MSMDDLYRDMGAFEKELVSFNQRLNASITDVTDQNKRVEPLWRDGMREEYERVWQPLHESMREYNQRLGPRYVEFFVEKLAVLRRYLHGG